MNTVIMGQSVTTCGNTGVKADPLCMTKQTPLRSSQTGRYMEFVV